MPIETFPNIAPGDKSQKTKEFRVLTADFGDGYSQSVPDGLNTHIESWDLTFEHYPASDINTITTFLDARLGSQSFYWTPPDELTPKLWKQDGSYSVAFNGPSTRTLNVTLKRVYSA